MHEYALIMMNMINYVGIDLKKSVEYEHCLLELRPFDKGTS